MVVAGWYITKIATEAYICCIPSDIKVQSPTFAFESPQWGIIEPPSLGRAS